MEIRIPSVGESVLQALVSKWLKEDGDAVIKDDLLCEIETDKITIEVHAEADGILSIMVPEGETVDVGSVIGIIKESGAGSPRKREAPKKEVQEAIPLKEERRATNPKNPEKEKAMPKTEAKEGGGDKTPSMSPAARKLAQEQGIPVGTILGTGKGGRIMLDDLREDAKKEMGLTDEVPGETAEYPVVEERSTTRKPMTPIRRRIAEHMLSARQQTAMLTTFNEADMGRIVDLRRRHKESFQKKHGISLGLMSFFVKACVESLKEFPQVNAFIEGEDILYHNYFDIGIAVGAEKGLVVPVLRNADRMSFAAIEKAIAAFVEKIKTNRLELSDLQGGTFTISNGGVYGSLLSTPILNPPQSGVLGMHAIQERPVALKGEILIRPMMYLAFSYDHRIIDGREAVGFLRKVKEYVEEPEELFLEG